MVEEMLSGAGSEPRSPLRASTARIFRKLRMIPIIGPWRTRSLALCALDFFVGGGLCVWGGSGCVNT